MRDWSSPRSGGYLAAFGGVVLLPAAIWAAFFSGSFDEGFFALLFTVLSILGTVLVTAGVLWFYPFASEGGEGEGALWASVGAAVLLLSLASLVLFGVMSLAGADSGRFYLTVSLLAWWVRSVGVVLMAFALIRTDILFGRALLLFLAAFLELPFLPDLTVHFGWDGAWATLLFGEPNVQTGVIGAFVWILVGYALITLDGGETPDPAPDGSPYASSPLRRL